MENPKISKKVVVGSAANIVAIIAILFLVYIHQKAFERTIVSQSQKQLLMVATTTAGRVEDYISEQMGSLKTAAMNPFTSCLASGTASRLKSCGCCLRALLRSSICANRT